MENLYIDIHKDQILSSNKEIYANVDKKERNALINKERPENTAINSAGYYEMIDVLDESPFEFSFSRSEISNKLHLDYIDTSRDMEPQ